MPTVFLLGGEKCGSTSLAFALSRHSQLQMARHALPHTVHAHTVHLPLFPCTQCLSADSVVCALILCVPQARHALPGEPIYFRKELHFFDDDIRYTTIAYINTTIIL